LDHFFVIFSSVKKGNGWGCLKMEFKNRQIQGKQDTTRRKIRDREGGRWTNRDAGVSRADQSKSQEMLGGTDISMRKQHICGGS
jgi:hypothetical protein